jgi:signal peptidase I
MLTGEPAAEEPPSESSPLERARRWPAIALFTAVAVAVLAITLLLGRSLAQHQTNKQTTLRPVAGAGSASATPTLVTGDVFFEIPSEAMASTLQPGDRVIIDSSNPGDIHCGDIVVFRRPPGEKDPAVNDLIKRVIGLPGDVVEGRDGQVVVNGKVIEEPYVDPGITTSTFGPTTVPAGYIWVMGDTRSNSYDSRNFGAIAIDLVRGRVTTILRP